VLVKIILSFTTPRPRNTQFYFAEIATPPEFSASFLIFHFVHSLFSSIPFIPSIFLTFYHPFFHYFILFLHCWNGSKSRGKDVKSRFAEET
jgi:hypothetical protein